MSTAMAPATDKPMTHDDIEAVFEDVDLFVERVSVFIESAIELSEKKGLLYGLMAEAMTLLGQLSREVDKCPGQIKKGIER